MLTAVGLLALSAVVGVGLAARHNARHELLAFVELERHDSRDAVVAAVRALAAANPGGVSPRLLQAAAASLGPRGAALLIDQRGGLLAAVGDPLRGCVVQSRRQGADLVVTITKKQGAVRLLLNELRLSGGFPVRLADGSPGTLLPLQLPGSLRDDRQEETLAALDRRLLGVTGAAALLALAIAATLARAVLAPVRQLQEATRDLALGRLDRRVAATGPREIAELGHAFNGMAAEMQRQQQLRRDLVNDVAHELRAPLTAMLCRLDAVSDGLDAQPATTLAGFHGDVEHLAGLVEDLQELALAEAGQLRLNCCRTPLRDAATSALQAAGLAADRRVRVDIEPQIAVVADPLRLRQVLVNLLTNASRHTPADGVIHLHAELRRAGEVQVAVADNGCGLDAEQQALVFERFWRTDPARQRATGGSGLGLAIVKSLVTAQGGRVWVHGTPGEGATFGFSLPAAAAGAAPAGRPGEDAEG